jgi:two-component system chemotaxis response regulator CheY
VKTGVEALREIREYDPEAYVIMLTSVADMDTVRECIALGAHSYILKSNPINKIKDKIQEVLNEF